MEVHHYPHIEKKGFKEYFLEFLMIFLAVTLGFFAENIRENISDRHKEKEYIESMVQDLKTDTAKFAYIIPANERQYKGYDSLLNYLYNFPYSDSSVKYIYYLQRKFGSGYINMDFTRRTFNQLQNAGGMQLIRSKTSSDGIINYYEFAANADQQLKEFSVDFMVPSEQTGYTIFNSKYYKGIGWDSLNKMLKSPERFSFISVDPTVFKTYANQMKGCEDAQKSYLDMLKHQRNSCIQLIAVLQNEYHLKSQ